MAFWGESLGATAQDPKRKFRFRVMFGGSAGSAANKIIWWAKSVDKPKMQIEPTEHKFMGHTFKFPGSVKWDEISLVLVDPVSEDAAQQTLSIISDAGYVFPEAGYALGEEGTKSFKTMNKAKSVAALGEFVIEQLDAEGVPVETWTLHNAFFTSVQFSDLSYESEDLSDITLSVTYDWAKLTSGESYKFKYSE